MIIIMRMDINMPSLKQFHILFVLVSMMLCLFLAYWTFNYDLIKYFSLSVISFFMIGFYGFKFYGKIKSLSL